MAAPKGNRFWEARSRHGSNPKYTPKKLWEAAIDYFNWVADNPLREAVVYKGRVSTGKGKPFQRPMTEGGFCIFADISVSTWDVYKHKDDYQEVTSKIVEVIRNQKLEGAMVGFFKENIIARDLGLADKAEHTGPGGGPVEINNTWNVQPVRPAKGNGDE